jgi:hypothetical protein
MFHLHVRRISKINGKLALSSYQYIARIGRYCTRGDIVRKVASEDLPWWVTSKSGIEFWQQADSMHMRSNGRLLFSIDIALPRSLSVYQQNQLAENFVFSLARLSVGTKTGGVLTTSYAVHEGMRADDAVTLRRSNPHLHVLISPSIVDGHKRSKENWFRRANANNALESGSPRSTYIGTKRWLLAVRQEWARLANVALKAAGLALRLDHRSHADRGLPVTPTIHVGAKASHLARIGTATHRTRRNSRIEKLNARLLAEQVLHQRAKKEAAKRYRIFQAQEDATRKNLLIAERQFEEEMQAHPLSGALAELPSVASVLLLISGCRSSSIHKSLTPVDDFAQQFLKGLPQKWQMLHTGGRYFYFHIPDHHLIVIGNGFAATDATDPALLKIFSQAISHTSLAPSRVFSRVGLEGVATDAFTGFCVAIESLQRYANSLRGKSPAHMRRQRP